MTDQETIYRDHANEYDRLVNAEDWEGNLLPAIESIAGPIALSSARVAEVGAGTGRITRLLARCGATIHATDRSDAMLAVAQKHLGSLGERCKLVQAEARSLPMASNWADLTIAGWVFGHFRLWWPENWKTSVGQAIDEMQRVTREGGKLIIIETLGTGRTEPAAPNDALAEYYQWMEKALGFVRKHIRTDYEFATVEEAMEITGFFFGKQFGEKVQREQWKRVPECTGLWFR